MAVSRRTVRILLLPPLTSPFCSFSFCFPFCHHLCVPLPLQLTLHLRGSAMSFIGSNSGVQSAFNTCKEQKGQLPIESNTINEPCSLALRYEMELSVFMSGFLHP